MSARFWLNTASISFGDMRFSRRGASWRSARRSGQLLPQDQRAPAAAVVALAARGGQVVGRAGDEAALLLEVVVSLRREAEQLGHPQRPGLRLGVLHQLTADPLVLIALVHAHRRQLRLVLLRV